MNILRTFNKSCKRYIYGSTYEMLASGSNANTFNKIPDWPYGIKECSYVMIELARFMTQFFVFLNNSIIGDRSRHFTKNQQKKSE